GVTGKMLSTLDVLSGGRITAGVAVGWMEEEFKALGVPFKERGAISDEYLAAIKALWTQDQPAFHGRYARFENIAFEPKPAQKPHIPLSIRRNSKNAIRRALALGDAWHPNPALVADIKTGGRHIKD